MMASIQSFDGEHRFLSNFWPCKVVYEGIEFKSVEHAYVAAKTEWVVLRMFISMVESAGKVKRIGQKIELRKDWEIVKVPLMTNFTEQKYEDPELDAMLSATAPFDLIEGNTWNDTFWGECPIGNGKNNLGKILMARRDDITRRF